MQMPFPEQNNKPQDFTPFSKACNLVGGCLDPRKVVLSVYVNQVCQGKAREAARLFTIAKQLPDNMNLN